MRSQFKSLDGLASSGVISVDILDKVLREVLGGSSGGSGGLMQILRIPGMNLTGVQEVNICRPQGGLVQAAPISTVRQTLTASLDTVLLNLMVGVSTINSYDFGFGPIPVGGIFGVNGSVIPPYTMSMFYSGAVTLSEPIFLRKTGTGEITGGVVDWEIMWWPVDPGARLVAA